MIQRPELILPHMIENARELLAAVEAMTAEYEANGIDSLANIDYGANANTMLNRLNNQFKMLDEAGLFTAGLID